MSDRAANEKASDRELTNWVKGELKTAGLPEQEVYSLQCMAHVLLGFASCATDDIKVLQAEIVEESGELGRDALLVFKCYGKTVALTGIILHTSDLLGPNVDEKKEVQGKWLSMCEDLHIKSLISNYKDNLFIGLFHSVLQK